MNLENDLVCPNCLVSLDTKADLSMHSCVHIKMEVNDSKDQKQTYNPGIDLNNYDNSTIDQKEEFILEDSFLELSEEFVTTILKQVDELCENIQIGDPDLKRTLEVNQNLNNAVGCYRVKLLELKACSEDSKAFKIEDPLSDYENSDSEYIPLKKKKMKMQSEGIKNMKNIGKLKKRKIDTGEPVDRPKTEGSFCDEELFPYIRVDDTKKVGEKGRMYCCFCNQLHPWRNSLFTHLNAKHYSEIKKDKSKDQTSEQTEVKKDCGESEKKMCKKLYGSKRRELWCLECKNIRIKEYKKAWKPPPGHKKKPREFQICIECGKSVKDMISHVNFNHNKVKQICVHCGKEQQSLLSLKQHIKLVHEKIPCVECGKLIGQGRAMKAHIASAHTPNDQKKYKCEICIKGFSRPQDLKDHINIHTGEKPYKCKFCSACFASVGNHAAHIRSHLGTNRRDGSKKLVVTQ